MPGPIAYPKKLIEVALPLDDINAEAAREKSIRHGHPSTLHLWWARRPLAAARAVIFAQMVNDPGGKRGWGAYKGQTKEDAQRERERLFDIIRDLVKWENTTNEEVLERARAEIRKSWRETCEMTGEGDPDALPAFHDPFAGGGALPLEAQRLGLEAYASDLNPVAVLINKAMIEIPPKFAGRPPVNPKSRGERTLIAKAWRGAAGLAEDVRYYGQWMREEAERRIGHLYPKVEITPEMGKERSDLKPLVGQKLTVIAWLWARTVKSPNPAFSQVDVPLASSFLLSTKAGKEAYVEPVVEGTGYRFIVKVGRPRDAEDAKNGTKLARGANFRCLMSGAPIAPEHVYSEAKAGLMGARLMAIVAESDRGRVYLTPTPEHEATARRAEPTWRPDVAMPENPRWFSPPLYGLKSFGDLFTPRQLVALTTFSELIGEAMAHVRQDALAAGMGEGDTGATGYATAVAVYLGFCLDKATLTNTTQATWQKDPDRLTQAFGRQAIPMVWDYAEANPLSEAGGGFGITAHAAAKVLERLPSSPPAGDSSQQDATKGLWADKRLVSTDPPYYDNIGYADLSDFFYVWLRRPMRPIFPDLFATLVVPKTEELVATPYRHGSKEAAEKFFLEGMIQAMRRLAEQAHPAFPVSIYYAFKQAETESAGGTASTGWETFLSAVMSAGFAVTGTWPMRTELIGNLKKEVAALASSIVLVCRRRDADAPGISRKQFLRELEAGLPEALEDMIGGTEGASPIAPVDLAQAAIGPGMAIFTKYSAVLEADGSPMSVRTALTLINKAIDEYFTHAESDMDGDTRFCVDWFRQYGFKAGPFGEADVLARAKGTAVDGMRDAGVIEASGGKVRLLKISEYPEDWDPRLDARTPIWEACHQLIHRAQQSEGAAGALFAKMPAKAEPVRQLAYRLYTLCERNKWAEEARAYNELIASWHAIAEESRRTVPSGGQTEMF